MSNERILLAGAVLLLAVAAAVATQRLRLPLLVTFLGLGMRSARRDSAGSRSTTPSSHAGSALPASC
jgi:NhaP-type Na+/H+ and K+/H+ antiporter